MKQQSMKPGVLRLINAAFAACNVIAIVSYWYRWRDVWIEWPQAFFTWIAVACIGFTILAELRLRRMKPPPENRGFEVITHETQSRH